MAAGEVQFIYLFSGLLAFGAVFLAFVPALHHAWTFAVSRRTFAVLLAAILGCHLVRLASGSRAQDLVLLSEQLAMALGASSLIVRAGLRIRPRDTPEVWPIWAAAVLLALAFVVVLPYAVPAFEIVYVV